MADIEKQDYMEVFERLIISQYRKPNFRALFRIISRIFSDIQDSNFLLMSLFWLDSATGEQLDFLGSLWGVTRLGRGDSDYRDAIYLAISRSSSGTISEIRSHLKSVYDAVNPIYSPEYPAGFRMRVDIPVFHSVFDEVAPAGVQGYVGGRIIDAEGNGLADAQGNCIIHVSDRIKSTILLASGRPFESISGEEIVTIGFRAG